MKKIECRPCEVGARRIVKEKTRTLGGVIEEHTYEVSPDPPNGLDYFPIFTTPEGVEVLPESALDDILASKAELVTEIEAASQIVHEMAGRAILPQLELARYQRVIDAANWTDSRRREAAALTLIGLGEGDDFVLPAGDRAFFTAQELAELFRCDEETIRRWSGSRLPAALRIGKRYLFKADAVLSMLKNAGPAHPPESSPRAKATA